MGDPIALLTLGCAVLAVVLLLATLLRGRQSAGPDPELARRELREELRSARDEARLSARELREEVTKSIEATQHALDRVRGTLDERVRELQQGNERKLDEMRRTVDEKLHDTLEKRLGESFKLVSDRLDTVHRGLGEMQQLATGVGDLKRVLTNVKARGTWAEVQLGAILEQVLTPDQYDKNVCIRPDTAERVEFAVRLPGPLDDPAACVWLPIDSKFPQEDWLRLQDASDHGDVAAVQAASEALMRTVRGSAKEIHDKYVHPPASTDFAIMFLATEGLFAEVLRHPSVVSDLQQQYRIVVAGPTTLAAILTSLRMGFQTLVVEQRAAEVWRVLGAVKTEFGKFGDVLDKVQRQLHTASRTIEETGQRSRAMEKKLRSAERLPDEEAAIVLELPAIGAEPLQ
ncbi:MAG: DNA recombination protein RmuC [Gemmatimonadota bacterium]|jgi:DNA recombination protein RmuC|nr:DNA recombination protein RmuC [Gemmatimonadota bacterium]MDQ8168167.1 DNA recombination protein RmuC [Gemmatimonadota bacterium]MDQ8173063.1 DNA recombination protein RmuC [Gemmatimonadota bacterium]